MGVTVGEILREDYMKPMGLTPYKLAKETGLSGPQVWQIYNGMRSVTPRSSLVLDRYFKQSPGFFLRLQCDCDIRKELENETR